MRFPMINENGGGRGKWWYQQALGKGVRLRLLVQFFKRATTSVQRLFQVIEKRPDRILDACTVPGGVIILLHRAPHKGVVLVVGGNGGGGALGSLALLTSFVYGHALSDPWM